MPEPGFEPWAAGWEARMLPKCYAAPKTRKVLPLANCLSPLNLEDRSKVEGNIKVHWGISVKIYPPSFERCVV